MNGAMASTIFARNKTKRDKDHNLSIPLLKRSSRKLNLVNPLGNVRVGDVGED